MLLKLIKPRFFGKKNLLLIAAFILTGFISAILADTLKILTEHFEHSLFYLFTSYKYLIFILPLAGLLAIQLLRKYLFNNKQNKGIKEVLNGIEDKHTDLPAFKIPSHYFNGFLTVIFGGSTGIEVSTVVATATVGSLTSKKWNILKQYKPELMCAGLAAGVTALFNAPLAGMLFAFEVFSKKLNIVYIFGMIASVSTAYWINNLLSGAPLFNFKVTTWHLQALPYFMLLGVLAGINSAYLTKAVLSVKKWFGSLSNDYLKVLTGAMALSVLIFALPGLYGDGYNSIIAYSATFDTLNLENLWAPVLLLLIKPIVTSITLGAGGDGGVFAPSLFIGAFLGLLTAFVLKYFFGQDIIAINFMVVGMAAVLSGSIHAPLTSIFLLCAIVGNYVLWLPILIACIIAKYTSHRILPYTVYSYKPTA